MTSGELDGYVPQDGEQRLNSANDRPSNLNAISGATQGAAPTDSTGPRSAPSLGGMRLPADFNTAHFFDPAFLAGMANEMYSEGRLPAIEGDATESCELTRMASAAASAMSDNSRGIPGVGRDMRAANRPIDYQDPKLFLGIANDSKMPTSADLPIGATSPGKVESEGYYFLTRAEPAIPAAVKGPTSTLSGRAFHVESIRQDFPILHQKIHGKPLIWLDNAATTQKPRRVIDALAKFYERDNSNIHRAAHTLAARATQLYEDAREKVRRFLGAAQVEEIVYVHGATEAINLVAQTYGKKFIGKGDEIVLSTLEHHSNIVPWFQLAQEQGAVLRVVPVDDKGEILLEEYERLLGPRTRLVALTHVSNALGTVVPVRAMTQMARRHGARVLLDGAQSVPHLSVDVQALDCDFYVFSGHKLFGPTGIGVLYAKREVLDSMPPWQGGGNMIDQVSFERVTYQPAPAKFEAGTGILAGAVGLGAAIDYLDELGMDNISRYEHELLVYATERMNLIPGLRMIGTATEKASVLSFVLEGTRSEDVGRFLDQQGIAVRAGHHCAQPALRRFGLSTTVRPSLAFYNTHSEIDALVDAIRKVKSNPG